MSLHFGTHIGLCPHFSLRASMDRAESPFGQPDVPPPHEYQDRSPLSYRDPLHSRLPPVSSFNPGQRSQRQHEPVPARRLGREESRRMTEITPSHASYAEASTHHSGPIRFPPSRSSRVEPYSTQPSGQQYHEVINRTPEAPPRTTTNIMTRREAAEETRQARLAAAEEKR